MEPGWWDDERYFVELSEGDDYYVAIEGYPTEVMGLGGDDVIYGLDGDDGLFGGDGHDELHGGSGNDGLEPGRGSFLANGGSGYDTIGFTGLRLAGAHITFAGAWDANGVQFGWIRNVEAIRGGLESETYSGDERDNFIAGHYGDDTIRGFEGDDRLEGEDGDDILEGGAGDDLLIGAQDDDTLDGGEGNDTVSYADSRTGVAIRLNLEDYGVSDLQDTGWTGVDRLISVENLIGSRASDFLRGNSDANRLEGRDGDDRLVGAAGDDTLEGGHGLDDLRGGDGADLLDGQDGDDKARGETGNDQVSGGAGDDWLFGDAGDDVIAGGAGKDVMLGGEGADRFVFAAGDSGVPVETRDMLDDFDSAAGDRIDLSALPGEVTFVEAFDGVAGQATLTHVNGVTLLRIDTDGDGTADFGLQINTTVTDSDPGWIL